MRRERSILRTSTSVTWRRQRSEYSVNQVVIHIRAYQHHEITTCYERATWPPVTLYGEQHWLLQWMMQGIQNCVFRGMQNSCYTCCTLALNCVWRPEPIGISIDSSFHSQLYFWLPFGALGVWDAVPGFLLCVSTCCLQGLWFPLQTLSDFLPPAYSPWLARRPYLANFAQQFTGFISCLEVGGNPLIGWASAEYGHYVVHKRTSTGACCLIGYGSMYSY